MNNVINIKNKKTGQLNTAVYAQTKSGNLRYHVDGVPLSDKKFDAIYAILPRSAKENILDVLRGKQMIFLENDGALPWGPKRLAKFMDKVGLKYIALLELREMPLGDILKTISAADGMIFQTQWLRPISTELKKFMFSLKDTKIVIECVLGEPTWHFKPKGIPHDLYILKTGDELSVSDEDWKFYKITDKPYWEYKNKFDR